MTQVGKNGTINFLLKPASELVKQFEQGHLGVRKFETQIQAFWFQICFHPNMLPSK